MTSPTEPLRILSGAPDAEEIAALVLALAAVRRAAGASPSAGIRPEPVTWLRTPVHHAPEAWTAAGDRRAG